jgi:hypothetical protein
LGHHFFRDEIALLDIGPINRQDAKQFFLFDGLYDVGAVSSLLTSLAKGLRNAQPVSSKQSATAKPVRYLRVAKPDVANCKGMMIRS